MADMQTPFGKRAGFELRRKQTGLRERSWLVFFADVEGVKTPKREASAVEVVLWRSLPAHMREAASGVTGEGGENG